MARKCGVISETPQLIGLVGPSQEADLSEAVLYRSDRYVALACDLADTKAFEELLAKELNASTCRMLCTAEVSVTYMDTRAADALISLAARYADSERRFLVVIDDLVLANRTQPVSAYWNNTYRMAHRTHSHER